MPVMPYLFSVSVFCIPLFCADASKTTTHSDTVTLKKIIQPFAHIQMHHNGITVPMLGLIIDAAYSKYARFVRIRCMSSESDSFEALQIPRTLIWSEDPRKNELMPELKHHKTGSLLFTKLSFDDPTTNVLDYGVESFNEQDHSQVTFNCIVHPNDTTARECRIVCENPLDISSNFNNQTFSRIHTLSIQAARIIGINALNVLCSKLPYLQNLYIMNTELEDTTLSLTHKELVHCEIAHTNLKSITSLETPLLRRLILINNQIDAFNTNVIGLRSFKLFFNNIGFIEKTVPYQPDWVKPLYIDLRKNPLKGDAITITKTQLLKQSSENKEKAEKS